MQWKTSQDLAAENYMMHMGPSAYNPYWNGMQPGMGMDGYMAPYGAPVPYMGYGMGPMDMPFGGPFPPDSFGGQGYMMPMVPPQRYASVSILSPTHSLDGWVGYDNGVNVSFFGCNFMFFSPLGSLFFFSQVAITCLFFFFSLDRSPFNLVG